MNKIVREHYPVERLPEDLRRDFGFTRTVTVTIEPENAPAEARVTVQDAIAELREIRARLPKSVADSVESVSRLRDEWDR